MSLRRSLLSSIALVAVTLTLAGCSLLPVFGSLGVAPASKPTVGQCWNATTTQAANWADWNGAASTSCANSHTLYTYQVGKISGETGDSWATPGSTGLTDAIQTKAAAACSISTLLPHLKWNQQLVTDYFFVPTEAQWKAGARWVRCDVGLLATGTTLGNERFATLPNKISSLVSAVSSNPVRFEFCLNSTTPVTEAGPLDNPAATIADCTDDPQWTLAAQGKFTEAPGAPFPDSATSNAVSSKACLPAVNGDNEVWVAYLPTKATWASGDREIDCWIGVKSSDTGSGGTA